MEVTYKVGDFRRLVMESSNEFKEKIGDGVRSGNKTESEKFYKETKKETGAKEEEHRNPVKRASGNKTTLDYTFDEDPGSDYKKRIKAQAKGYTSPDEEKNGIEKVGEFTDGFYRSAKEQGKEMQRNVENLKKSGLQGSKMPAETFKKEDMYENRNIKTVVFKRTDFINESYMKSRIPDTMKNEGEVFRMKDRNGCTYLVEWTDNGAEVLEYNDQHGLDEATDRMKKLFSYRPSDHCEGTDVTSRVDETTENFKKTLDAMRRIIG